MWDDSPEWNSHNAGHEIHSPPNTPQLYSSEIGRYLFVIRHERFAEKACPSTGGQKLILKTSISEARIHFQHESKKVHFITLSGNSMATVPSTDGVVKWFSNEQGFSPCIAPSFVHQQHSTATYRFR